MLYVSFPNAVNDILMGNGSVSVPSVPGKRHRLAGVLARFPGTGPQTGTLRLRINGIVEWEAAVSGGISIWFPGGGIETPPGATVTAELTGATIQLLGGTEA
jgi:hypothetical protein